MDKERLKIFFGVLAAGVLLSMILYVTHFISLQTSFVLGGLSYFMAGYFLYQKIRDLNTGYFVVLVLPVFLLLGLGFAIQALLVIGLLGMFLSQFAYEKTERWEKTGKHPYRHLLIYGTSILLIGFLFLPVVFEKFLGTEVEMPVPEGMFRTASGEMFSLKEVEGKVVIIDFWATWCGPCRAAMPEMEDLYKHYKDHTGVSFYFVNTLSGGDTQARAEAFIRSKGYDLPVVYDVEDLGKRLGVSSIPHTLIIDPKGNIRYRHTGYFIGEDIAGVISHKIEEFLKK